MADSALLDNIRVPDKQAYPNTWMYWERLKNRKIGLKYSPRLIHVPENFRDALGSVGGLKSLHNYQLLRKVTSLEDVAALFYYNSRDFQWTNKADNVYCCEQPEDEIINLIYVLFKSFDYGHFTEEDYAEVINKVFPLFIDKSLRATWRSQIFNFNSGSSVVEYNDLAVQWLNYFELIVIESVPYLVIKHDFAELVQNDKSFFKVIRAIVKELNSHFTLEEVREKGPFYKLYIQGLVNQVY
jgi:hypothetical protein